MLTQVYTTPDTTIFIVLQPRHPTFAIINLQISAVGMNNDQHVANTPQYYILRITMNLPVIQYVVPSAVSWWAMINQLCSSWLKSFLGYSIIKPTHKITQSCSSRNLLSVIVIVDLI